MKLSHVILCAAVVLAPASVFGQASKLLTATKGNEYGIIYTLPVNQINVTIEARKTVKTPGEFFQYSKKYLNIEPIIEKSVSWQLENVEITASAVADNSHEYLARFKAGQPVSMLVTPESFPVSLGDVEYEAAEISTPSLEAIPAQPTILELPVARQAVTEDMLKAQSTAKRAELAAMRIAELRQQRNDIISGNADNMPSDGAAMKIALDNIEQQEQALTAMFVGTVSESTEVKTFSYLPEGDEDKYHTVIARLSALDGIVPADDLSGDPVYLDITVTRRGQLPKNEKGVEKTFPKEGVAYRIPGAVDVAVKYDGRQVAFVAMPMAQFGVVFGLDPALFTAKKAPAYLHFEPSTGAIVELGELVQSAE